MTGLGRDTPQRHSAWMSAHGLAKSDPWSPARLPSPRRSALSPCERINAGGDLAARRLMTRHSRLNDAVVERMRTATFSCHAASDGEGSGLTVRADLLPCALGARAPGWASRRCRRASELQP